jgi:MoaA/NifB/PqqE/SkfB family radical SAM enzyme
MLMTRAARLAPFLWHHLPVLLKGVYRRDVRRWPYAFSFNIADRCPVGCHCYWRAQARVAELSDDEVIAFFRRKRHDGYLHANLVGGEPYVRPDLLSQVAGILPFSWVITSGTTPLRRLRHTTHVISVDGATSATHDRVRRTEGLHARLLKHLGNARAGGDFPAFIHTTLNAVNYQEIDDIVARWAGNGLADGIMVSTLTPIRHAGDEGLRLSRAQRVWIVDELLRLKHAYGAFLCMTEAMIRRLHPDHTQHLSPDVCHTARFIESYDASGARMRQCILSEQADCRECGCVVTTMSDPTEPARFGRMVETRATVMRTFSLH